MEFIDIGSIILLIIVIIVTFLRIKRLKLINNDLNIKEKEIDDLNNNLKLLSIKKENQEKEIKEKEGKKKGLDFEIQQKSEFNSTLHKVREQELDTLIDTERTARIKALQREVEEWGKSAQEARNEMQAIELQRFEEEKQALLSNLDKLSTEISNFQEKQNAIAAEIRRARAIEEKQDFYRICLDEESKYDISILLQVQTKLSKIDLLNKIIYDTYVSKFVKEMERRVLGAKSPSGIYKVTNIQTKEVYIGKSTDIAKRWVNHVKSVYGLEGAADSMFQRALKRYGIDQFVWEILEEVPKEKLTEREKFYINFYNTKEVGYNERLG